MIATDTLQQDHGVEVTALVLVCRVFAGTATREELQSYIRSNTIDWQAFYKLAAIHQVRPVVYSVLYNLDIPASVKEQLQADCKYITFQNFGIAKEMTRLYGLLQKAGIYAVPWKGPVFCLDYYKDIGMREFCDIDFLINFDLNEHDVIKKIFSDLGYVDKFVIPDAFKETHFNHTREYYFDFYENDARKFHAEFHWYTASQIFDFVRPMPNSVLFNNLNEQDIYGTATRTLNATSHFIAIVAHHGLNQRWGLLKYMLDLSQIMRNGTPLNYEEIVSTTKTYGFNKPLNIGLSLASELLGVNAGISYDRPGDVDRYMNDLLSSANKKKKPILTTLAVNLKIKDNAADKFRMSLKYLAFAASPSILDYSFLPLPRPLFFLYPLVKPFRILSNSLRNKGQ